MKEQLIKLLAEALEMESVAIKEDDNFRDYENYSSLSELSVLAMLDSEFGIEIEMKEFDNYLTVHDLINLVSIKYSK
jgi:acyl carrier protein